MEDNTQLTEIGMLNTLYKQGVLNEKEREELITRIKSQKPLNELKTALTHFDTSDESLFTNITLKMQNLFASKNKAYGNSFSQLYKEYGNLAGIIPLSNKLNRIKTLSTANIDTKESLVDSLFDLCCYGVMFLMEVQRKD